MKILGSLAAAMSLIATPLYALDVIKSEPLTIGISGTLVALAVMITRTQQTEWFPWVLPFNTLVTPTPERYALAGLVIGLPILAAMVPLLARHQYR